MFTLSWINSKKRKVIRTSRRNRGWIVQPRFLPQDLFPLFCASGDPAPGAWRSYPESTQSMKCWWSFISVISLYPMKYSLRYACCFIWTAFSIVLVPIVIPTRNQASILVPVLGPCRFLWAPLIPAGPFWFPVQCWLIFTVQAVLLTIPYGFSSIKSNPS